MPHAEVRVRTKASYETFPVLSHLMLISLFLTSHVWSDVNEKTLLYEYHPNNRA